MREMYVQLMIHLPEDFGLFQGFGEPEPNQQIGGIIYNLSHDVSVVDYYVADQNYFDSQRIAILTLKCCYDSAGKLFLKANPNRNLLTICKMFLIAANFTKVVLYTENDSEDRNRWWEHISECHCDNYSDRKVAIAVIEQLLPKPEYTALEPRQYSNFDSYKFQAYELFTATCEDIKEKAKEMLVPMTIGIAAGITLEAIYKSTRKPR